MNTVHKPIKRFGLDGKVMSSTAFSRVQSMYMKILEEQMREQGYVPRLELGMEWTTVRTKEHYEFEISLYGSYVGKASAWSIEGIDQGKPVSIHPNKSNMSSKSAEAQSKEK